jgi:hypothetical protein
VNAVQHLVENIPLDASKITIDHWLTAQLSIRRTNVPEDPTDDRPRAPEQLVARAADKNAAFMRGDMERWSSLVRFAPGFTLMQPFGGPASHGFDVRPERLAEMARYFRNGKTDLEVAKTYASQDIVVLVMIERQTAEVGGLPAQDWSLRVTEVYQRNGTEWEFAHRHADPLVRRFTLEQMAPLARGAL